MKLFGFVLALLTPGFVATAAAVVGAAASAYSASQSGGGGGGGGASPYSPADLGWASSEWSNLLASQLGIARTADQVKGLPQESLARGQAIDWAPYLNASNLAGSQTSALAPQAQQLAQLLQMLSGQAGQEQNALYGAGNQAYQTALDPQNALYNRTLQQTLDTGRAGQAARGLGVSAEGQRLEDQSVSNFNIDWQNQQLQRQLAGLQGMAGAANAGATQGTLAGKQGAGALDAAALAPQFTQQGASIPLQAQQQYAQDPGNLSNNYLQQLMALLQPYQAQQNQIIPYLYQGAGSNNAAAQLNLQQQGFNAQQQQGAFNSLAQSLQGLSGLFQPSSNVSQGTLNAANQTSDPLGYVINNTPSFQ